MKRSLLLLSVALVMESALARPGSAADRDDLAAIMANWKARQDKVRSAEYQVEGKVTIPKGRFNGDPDLRPGTKGDTPKQDYVYEAKTRWLIGFDENVLRKENREERFFLDSLIFNRVYEVQLWDGKQLRKYSPREENTGPNYTPSSLQPDLWVQTAHYKGFILNAFDYPVFLAHGNIPTPSQPIDATRLRIPLDESAFAVNARGVLDGHNCLILRTSGSTRQPDSRTEYWVDVDRGGIVLRATRHWRETTESLQNIAYQSTEYGWLPKSWTTCFYDPRRPDMVSSFRDVRVTSFSINPVLDKADFAQAYRAGMVVRDVEKQADYKVDSDNRSLVPWDGKKPTKRENSVLLWIATGCAVGILFALCIRRFLRYRRAERTA